MDAVQGADALVLVTEWKAYRSPDWSLMKAALHAPIVFDGRNLYEPHLLEQEGFELYGIGRGKTPGLTQIEGDGSSVSLRPAVASTQG
jgi:UDPglucose 6-dehydrogenase